MWVRRVHFRDLRNYEHADVELAEGVNVVTGWNGAGKTNLLEGVYFGLTGRSPRTSNERELVRRGASVTRVVIDTADSDGAHRIEVGFEPGGIKRVRVDGCAVDGLVDLEARPLASVFLPERLELVKGPPSGRRAHLDRLVAALRPARAGARLAYSRALAQRNALLGRIRGAQADWKLLDAWDAEVARRGIALMDNRREAVEALRAPFAELARRLGLPGQAGVAYRARSDAVDLHGLAAELAERREADIQRGFTAHGPHRDELSLSLDGNSLRAYGSQGQQRVALLALLFAERRVLAERRGRTPLMLLDDVMSELDGERRKLLADLLGEGGQAIVTATAPDQVPRAALAGGGLLMVEGGTVAGTTRAVAA